MAIRLEKGQRINLEKDNGAKLTSFCVGCNWGAIIVEKTGFLGFGTKKEEAIRVYSNISFCITQTEGFLTEREKVVYFSLVKRILDDAESAIRQLDDEMKKLLKNEESKQIDNVGNKIEIELFENSIKKTKKKVLCKLENFLRLCNLYAVLLGNN